MLRAPSSSSSGYSVATSPPRPVEGKLTQINQAVHLLMQELPSLKELVGATLGMLSICSISSGKYRDFQDVFDEINALFNGTLRADPFELKEAVEKRLISLREAGYNISDAVNPGAILEAACPREEFYRQFYLLHGVEPSLFYTITEATFKIGFLGIVGPAAEEYLFREGLQNYLLKTEAKDYITKISPERASLVDTKIYTIFRILITATCFSLQHLLSKGGAIFSDDYVDFQVRQTFFLGLFLGVLRETNGISLCICAHVINNLIAVMGSYGFRC